MDAQSTILPHTDYHFYTAMQLCRSMTGKGRTKPDDVIKTLYSSIYTYVMDTAWYILCRYRIEVCGTRHSCSMNIWPLMLRQYPPIEFIKVEARHGCFKCLRNTLELFWDRWLGSTIFKDPELGRIWQQAIMSRYDRSSKLKLLALNGMVYIDSKINNDATPDATLSALTTAIQPLTEQIRSDISRQTRFSSPLVSIVQSYMGGSLWCKTPLGRENFVDLPSRYSGHGSRCVIS